MGAFELSNIVLGSRTASETVSLFSPKNLESFFTAVTSLSSFARLGFFLVEVVNLKLVFFVVVVVGGGKLFSFVSSSSRGMYELVPTFLTLLGSFRTASGSGLFGVSFSVPKMKLMKMTVFFSPYTQQEFFTFMLILSFTSMNGSIFFFDFRYCVCVGGLFIFLGCCFLKREGYYFQW